MEFENDTEAVEYLESHGLWQYANGVYRLESETWRSLTNGGRIAIWYLVHEWDFHIEYV